MRDKINKLITQYADDKITGGRLADQLLALLNKEVERVIGEYDKKVEEIIRKYMKHIDDGIYDFKEPNSTFLADNIKNDLKNIGWKLSEQER